MTTLAHPAPIIDEVLDPAHQAQVPPEARGLRRDGVRLLVSRGTGEPEHARFTDLPDLLDPGDLVVVNTSATVPAALDGVLASGEPVVVHVSTPLPAGLWLVEVRRPVAGATQPFVVPDPTSVALLGGGHVTLHVPFPGSQRLWVATFTLPRLRRWLPT